MELKITSKGKEYTVLYDEEDHELIRQYHWCITKGDYVVGYKGQRRGKNLSIMHRIIMGVDDPCVQIDHINHVPYDNRKINLRLCNQEQNNFNSVSIKNTSSRYKGVSYNKRAKGWEAYISVNNKKINLGWYKDELKAATSYDVCAIIFRGEFANLNLPENEKFR